MIILPKESKKYSVTAKTDEPYAKEVCKVLIAKPCSIGQIAKDNIQNLVTWLRKRIAGLRVCNTKTALTQIGRAHV